MKRNTLTILLLSMMFAANAQSSGGLIAHWDMNGSVNDVSGNGHNGNGINITPVAGMSGVPNTAYYFNGINSVITAPYLPDLNVTQYSICAQVLVDGFFTGTCQANWIFTRGWLNYAGSYGLYFGDNLYDSDCYAVDTMQDVFAAFSGAAVCAVSSDWLYTPRIVENKWYKLIATWDGLSWKTYVNDTLKTTVLNTGGALGTSTDSISIGMDIFGLFQWPFKGVIDDISVYNRVLTDSEIVHYGDTCGRITVQPASYSCYSGHSAVFNVSSSIASPVYQWQQDAGLGFVNLTNAGPYSGVNTNALTITGVSASLNALHYRCVITNSYCHDTSSFAILTISDLNINTFNSGNAITLYPNPVGNELNIIATDKIKSVKIYNIFGQALYDLNFNSEKIVVNIADLPSGIYFVRINGEEVRKFVKAYNIR